MPAVCVLAAQGFFCFCCCTSTRTCRVYISVVVVKTVFVFFFFPVPPDDVLCSSSASVSQSSQVNHVFLLLLFALSFFNFFWLSPLQPNTYIIIPTNPRTCSSSSMRAMRCDACVRACFEASSLVRSQCVQLRRRSLQERLQELVTGAWIRVKLRHEPRQIRAVHALGTAGCGCWSRAGMINQIGTSVVPHRLLRLLLLLLMLMLLLLLGDSCAVSSLLLHVSRHLLRVLTQHVLLRHRR